MSASNYRSYTAISAWSNNARTSIDNVSQSGSMGHDWKVDNTLSYSFNLNDNQFDVLIGQTAEKWGMGLNLNSSGANSIFPGYISPNTNIKDVMNYAWVDNTKPTELSQRGAGGSVWGEGAIASFFGRINYNYKEKYMATLIFRADGSSNFARGKRWGYFPSASVGWTVSNEDFMAGAADIIDFLKIRASWGQNGNCSISNFQYLSTIAFDVSNGYYFAADKKTQTVGGYADILANPDVTWETSEQLNIGLDARFARGRMGLAFDWYQKMTRNWLLTAPIPAVYGLNAPAVNGGDVMNTGVELALTWDDFVGDFRYGISVNGTYNKNEVTRIANAEGIIHGAANVLSQGTTEMYRAQEGYPLGYFYGYKTAGVFQNWDQVNNTSAKYDGAKPGDLIFVDHNGDGKITEDDRTMIGSGHPDFLLGFNLYFAWKGLDFSITGAGAFGQEIAKSYRSFADSPLQNFTTDIFGRWTGEGTSNKLPRLTTGSNINWQNISDIYIEKGDYVKIQNVQLGYDFKQAFRKLPFGQVRLYVSAQNVYTFTKYSGLDPEIGYGADQGWVQGIDLGYYPAPRTYMVGLNIKF
jgi:TonB-linked SusC/RagA family outer membrane protein